MLRSEVATGRRMKGAEMCIFYPEFPGPAPIYNVESTVLEGSKGRFGFKNSEPFAATFLSSLQHSPTISARLSSKSNFSWKPVKRTIIAADKNYWKCNLALICASYYRAARASLIQFLDGTNMRRFSRLTRSCCAQTTYVTICRGIEAA
jgi:hypothetical protein